MILPPIEDRYESGIEFNNLDDNAALHSAPFSVSVDLIGHGGTIGISSIDRSLIVKALINPEITAKDQLARTYISIRCKKVVY
ncbi:MAG: hypothetical protein IPI31_09595 [Bacteroidetes bacterium]|nr:hypothetical protein [Bacteroidota bacterium]